MTKRPYLLNGVCALPDDGLRRWADVSEEAVRQALFTLHWWERRSAGLDEPPGFWRKDGVWMPDEAEWASGTFTYAKAPNARRPMRFYDLACSLPHCALLAHVDLDTVRLVQLALKGVRLRDERVLVAVLEEVPHAKALAVTRVLSERWAVEPEAMVVSRRRL